MITVEVGVGQFFVSWVKKTEVSRLRAKMEGCHGRSMCALQS